MSMKGCEDGVFLQFLHVLQIILEKFGLYGSNVGNSNYKDLLTYI